jgi:hypothetical protein
MAASNWSISTGGLSLGSLDKGVTSGIAPPPGGGSFVYGFNSLSVVDGAAALFANQVNFAPMAKGGSARAVIQRGISGGPTNFSPFVFVAGQGPAITDYGYLLGLQDDDPHRIVLRKGVIGQGLPAGLVNPLVNGILSRSTATFAPGTWLHLRLDSVVNLNGDVVLNVYRSDFTLPGVTLAAPDWQPIPGMPQFIDDTLHVNTGTAPYTSGRAGFGFSVKDVTRRGYFSHLEIERQL